MRAWMGLVLMLMLLWAINGASSSSSSSNDDNSGSSYIVPVNTEFESGSEIPVEKKGGGLYQVPLSVGACRAC